MNLALISDILAQIFPLICVSVAFLTCGLLFDPDFQKQKWVAWAAALLAVICFAGMSFIKGGPGITGYDWALQIFYLIPLLVDLVVFVVTLYAAYFFEQKEEVSNEVRTPYIAPEIHSMAHEASQDVGGTTMEMHPQHEEEKAVAVG